MAETLGSLIDKICIMELKVFHMHEQVVRRDASEDHRLMCQVRLDTLRLQRDDLMAELNDLTERCRKGTWQPKVYRQFKMYNDPRFRIKSEARAT